MNHAQGRIAVLHGIHNNPHGKYIVNLIQGLILVDHLPVNAEEMLYPAIHLRLNLCLLDVFSDLIDNLFHKSFSCPLPEGNLIRQFLKNLRLQIFQR